MNETPLQVALTIAPLHDGSSYRIGISFQTDYMQQSVALPYDTIEAASAFADNFKEAFVKAAEECKRLKLGLVLPGK